MFKHCIPRGEFAFIFRLFAGTSMLALSLASAAAASTEQRMNVAIADKNLPEALLYASAQAGVSIAFPSARLRDMQAPSLTGTYTIDELLTQLLAGTGLKWEYVKGDTVRVYEPKAAQAQISANDASPPPQRQTASVPVVQGSIDEIIVTAQKREERLKDVPIAITALSAATMEERGIESPVDLQFSVPSLDIGRQSSTFSISNPTMRGLTTIVSSVGGDPAVTFNVDGFFSVSEFGLMSDFLDVQRVEVLRGPQGTLYGRDTLGGSINVITQRLGKAFDGQLSVNFGNFDQRRVTGILSGPVTEKLGARLAFASESRGGFIENVSPQAKNRELGTADNAAVRAAVDIDITDNISAAFNLFHYSDDGINGVYQLQGTAFGPATPYQIRVNDPYDQNEKSDSASMSIDWRLNGVTFRLLNSTGITNTAYRMDTDVTDTTTTPYLARRLYQFSTHEVQAVSDPDSRLRWIAGFYSLELKGKASGGNTLDPRTLINELAHTESLAAYGHGTYAITEQWEVVGGVRYTRDHKTLNLRGLKGDFTWEPVTYNAGVNFKLSDQVMFYVTHSKGFRAGGGTAQGFFDPEKLYDYEGGVKARLFERMSVDAAIFHYDQPNKQVSISSGMIGSANFVRNAGKAATTGIELEAGWDVSERITINASGSYLDAKVTEYRTGDPKFPNLGIQDLSGNELRYTPQWRGYLGASYKLPVAGIGTFTARVDHSWTGERQSDEFNYPNSQLPAYERTNARLRWDDPGRRWALDIYVNNLENDAVLAYYSIRTVAPPSAFTQYLPPRTFGVKLSRKFSD